MARKVPNACVSMRWTRWAVTPSRRLTVFALWGAAPMPKRVSSTYRSRDVKCRRARCTRFCNSRCASSIPSGMSPFPSCAPEPCWFVARSSDQSSKPRNLSIRRSTYFCDRRSFPRTINPARSTGRSPPLKKGDPGSSLWEREVRRDFEINSSHKSILRRSDRRRGRADRRHAAPFFSDRWQLTLNRKKDRSRQAAKAQRDQDATMTRGKDLQLTRDGVDREECRPQFLAFPLAALRLCVRFICGFGPTLSRKYVGNRGWARIHTDPDDRCGFISSDWG
jgi:hypothetical protein